MFHGNWHAKCGNQTIGDSEASGGIQYTALSVMNIRVLPQLLRYRIVRKIRKISIASVSKVAILSKAKRAP